MGQADDHVDLTFGLTFQPCSWLSLALATRHLIKVSHTREEGNKKKKMKKSRKGMEKDRAHFIITQAEESTPAIFALFVKQTLCKWGDGEGYTL